MSNVHRYERLQVDGLRSARRFGLGNGVPRVIMVPWASQFAMAYQQFFNSGSRIGYGCGGTGFGRF
ncbi:hypothetical protein I4U23_031502 [Adineta vaga]|nr:hypothetical protein I4U23_031502 [Adineta vaga]